MKDVAYLLATLDQLRHTTAILDVSSATIKEDTWVKYRTITNEGHITKERWHAFNAKDLATTLLYPWEEVKPRVITYLYLLHIPLTIEEDIAYCCYLALKQNIEDSIQYAEIIGDNLKYRRSGVTKYAPIQEELNLVLGTEAILDGLAIRDYAGSHYTVVTPAKKEHLTTASSCSCNEFYANRRCSHTKIISLLPTHRRALQENNVLTIKF